jgi:hypothetical protein
MSAAEQIAIENVPTFIVPGIGDYLKGGTSDHINMILKDCYPIQILGGLFSSVMGKILKRFPGNHEFKNPAFMPCPEKYLLLVLNNLKNIHTGSL